MSRYTIKGYGGRAAGKFYVLRDEGTADEAVMVNNGSKEHCEKWVATAERSAADRSTRPRRALYMVVKLTGSEKAPAFREERKYGQSTFISGAAHHRVTLADPNDKRNEIEVTLSLDGVWRVRSTRGLVVRPRVQNEITVQLEN